MIRFELKCMLRMRWNVFNAEGAEEQRGRGGIFTRLTGLVEDHVSVSKRSDFVVEYK